MSEPDELYTLRAQFWLGHYAMAIQEAKSIARRPMSPALKAEREEFLARANVAMGHYEKSTTSEIDSPALQAIALKGQFDGAMGNEAVRESVVNQLKSMLASEDTPVVHVVAAQVLLAAGQTKEALQAVHAGASLEQVALCLQIYLKIDRLDLAQKQLAVLRKTDEDAVLTQLGSVYVSLATGSTGAADALHTVTMLSEQYGPSSFLLNLTACALMQRGDYVTAEEKLQECVRDFAETPMADTYVNLIVCAVHQNKPSAELVSQMRKQYPLDAFCAGLDRVVTAFDREAIKYMV